MIINNKIENKIQKIINSYNKVIKTVDQKARKTKGRAYGGVIRSIMGTFFQDEIVRRLILIAWLKLGGNPKRISFSTEKIKIPIKRNYIEKIKNETVKKFLLENINKCNYQQKTDLHVFIDNKFIMGVECRVYTENAMMKRILVDFTFF